MTTHKIKISKGESAIYDGHYLGVGFYALNTEIYRDVLKIAEPHNTLLNMCVPYEKNSEGFYTHLDRADMRLHQLFESMEVGKKAELTNITRGQNCVVLCDGDESKKLKEMLIEFDRDVVEALLIPETELFFDVRMSTLLFVADSQVIALVTRTSQDSLNLYNDFEATANIVMSAKH